MSEKPKFYTNYHKRPIIYWEEMTKEEQKEFDFDAAPMETYVKYKDNIICIGEFMRIERHMRRSFPVFWHGYTTDSFFSGLVLHLCNDSDYVIIGTFIG